MKNSGIPWIGEIPEGWKVERTKNVLECGKEIVGAQSANTQLLSLTTKGIRRVEMGSTSGKVPHSYDTYQDVHPGNMVFCLFDLDCSAVFSGVSQYDGMISPAYKVTTLLNNHCPKFYGYWFDYIFDGRKYMFLSKNIRYSLTYDEFAALGIVSPPYAEQQAIADFLDKKCAEIDQPVGLQEKFIEELKAYKQSLITETVTKGLNPNAPMKDSGVECIGNVPQQWDVILLPFVFRNLDYLREPISAEQRSRKNPIYDYYGASGIIDKIDFYNVDDDVLLIGEDGANLRMRNLPLIYRATGKFWVNNHAHILKPIKDNINFMQYMLEALDYNDFITGSAQPKLSQDNLAKVRVCVPPLPEQQAIADYLDKKCAEIDQLIAIKQKKADELKEYKKSIIYEYVTGKRSVCE